LVLAAALESLGKRVRILNSEALAERYAFMDPKKRVQARKDGEFAPYTDGYVLAVMDTSDETNLGSAAGQILGGAKEVFFLDHHEQAPGNRLDGYADTTASSTSELALEIIGRLGARLDPISARAAYAGIVFDTGSFIYPKTTARTFRAAVALVEAGAVPNEIYKAMYESASVGALLLQQRVLSSMELAGDGRVAIQTMLKADLEAAGANYDDAEPLINIPLHSKNIEVSILIKENAEGRLRCSLRSKGEVNVSTIAQSFGGGGHRTAAGFKCPQGLAETKSEVLQKVSAALRAADTGA